MELPVGLTWLGGGDAACTFQSDTRKVRRKEKRGRGGGKREEEGPTELTCRAVTTRMRASTCDPGVLFGVVQVGGGGDLACPYLDADALAGKHRPVSVRVGGVDPP